MVSININIYIDKIEYTIYKDDDEYKAELNSGELIIPKAFNSGEQLKYIRKIIATIIDQYSIKNAWINLDEDTAIGVINMVKMEGVIEELLASYEVNRWK